MTLVRNGYSCLPIALSEGLNIKLSSAANLIKYSENGNFFSELLLYIHT